MSAEPVAEPDALSLAAKIKQNADDLVRAALKDPMAMCDPLAFQFNKSIDALAGALSEAQQKLRDSLPSDETLKHREFSQEPEAWLVVWRGPGDKPWHHAHASELPAVEQARKYGGKCTPMYRLASLGAPGAEGNTK